MKRKLVKQGPSSLTISIPSEWIKKNHLEPGDSVEVSIEENSVHIKPPSKGREPEPISLNVHRFSDTLISDILQAMYKKGHSDLRINCRSEQSTNIQKVIRESLLGFEVVEQKPELLRIKFITRSVPDELPTLTRRLFLVVLSLAEGFLDAQIEDDELCILEETTDRLANYCEHILVKHSTSEPNAIFKYQIVTALERIADEYRELIEANQREVFGARELLLLLQEAFEIYSSYTPEAHDAFLEHLAAVRADIKQRESPALRILWVVHQLREPLAGLYR